MRSALANPRDNRAGRIPGAFQQRGLHEFWDGSQTSLPFDDHRRANAAHHAPETRVRARDRALFVAARGERGGDAEDRGQRPRLQEGAACQAPRDAAKMLAEKREGKVGAT
jgi:hypothetical protein